MTHHGDASVVLDISDEGVASAWNDEVNVPVQLEERRDFGSGLDALDVRARYRRPRQPARDRGREQLRRPVGLLPAFQDGSVSCQ